MCDFIVFALNQKYLIWWGTEIVFVQEPRLRTILNFSFRRRHSFIIRVPGPWCWGSPGQLLVDNVNYPPEIFRPQEQRWIFSKKNLLKIRRTYEEKVEIIIKLTNLNFFNLYQFVEFEAIFWYLTKLRRRGESVQRGHFDKMRLLLKYLIQILGVRGQNIFKLFTGV